MSLSRSIASQVCFTHDVLAGYVADWCDLSTVLTEVTGKIRL
jgi:hypothetical protein